MPSLSFQMYAQTDRFLGEVASKLIPRNAQKVHDWGEKAQQNLNGFLY